jgi:phosphatidylinositol glycan class B
MNPSTDEPASFAEEWRRFVAKPLPWLLLLAALLRATAAFQPGFHHPDAIYQYLEPAHRILTGEGAVTWEWRVGMRSWLLPMLLVPPMALGEALGPAGPWPVALPRLAMGAASLSIVWSAWQLGCRRSPYAGLLAGFVAATWFECLYFGVQTLAEPAAAAAFLPAAVLVTAMRPTRHGAAIAGALLAFAVLMRPHYAPGAATLVLVAWWPWRADRVKWSIWAALIGGGLTVAAAGATIDIASGAIPFAWIAENIRQNIISGVAARYGVSPSLTYLTWLLQIWIVWAIPLVIGLRFGWRASPALLAAATMTLAVHMLIGHKEFRFIYLVVVTIVILSAIGWSDIVERAVTRWGERARPRLRLAVVAAWGIASLLLAFGPLAQAHRRQGVPGSRVFALLRDDPQTCGVALVYGTSYADIPGTAALRPGTPVGLFWFADPAGRGVTPWQSVAHHQSGFNRIVSSVPRTGVPPQGYRTISCEPASDVIGMCLYARPGGCTATRTSPFLLNRVLARMGF